MQSGFVIKPEIIHHYQHAEIIQLICSIHQDICEARLIFLSHDLKDCSYF